MGKIDFNKLNKTPKITKVSILDQDGKLLTMI